MANRLADKIAIGTGGGPGIGRATALQFAEEVAQVTIADRSLSGFGANTGLGPQISSDTPTVGVDVSNPDRVSKMFLRTVYRFGQVDTLVNAAGVPILTRH